MAVVFAAVDEARGRTRWRAGRGDRAANPRTADTTGAHAAPTESARRIAALRGHWFATEFTTAAAAARGRSTSASAVRVPGVRCAATTQMA